MKNFKILLSGSFISKIFGLGREFLFFIFLADSLQYSEILSLLVISSLFSYLCDTTFLNPIIFPIWKKGRTEIVIGKKEVFVGLMISIFFWTYNLNFIEHSQSVLNQIICSVIWIPLFYLGIGYSAFIFEKKIIFHSRLNILTSSTYFIFFWIIRDYGANAYLYSRLLSIIVGCSFIAYAKPNLIKFNGTTIYRIRNFKNSLINFFNVSNFIVSIFILKMIFSIYLLEKTATLNYSLVIIFTFYTLFSKNINSLIAIEKSQKNDFLKIQIISLMIFMLFLFSVRYSLMFFGKKIIDNYDLLIEIIDNSIYLLPMVSIITTLDLLNSKNILNNTVSYNKMNFFYFTIGLGSYLGIYLLCQDLI